MMSRLNSITTAGSLQLRSRGGQQISECQFRGLVKRDQPFVRVMAEAIRVFGVLNHIRRMVNAIEHIAFTAQDRQAVYVLQCFLNKILNVTEPW